MGKPCDLRRHVNSVHDGKKDHVCDFCDKAYTRAEHLKAHIANVHEEENAVFSKLGLKKTETTEISEPIEKIEITETIEPIEKIEITETIEPIEKIEIIETIETIETTETV